MARSFGSSSGVAALSGVMSTVDRDEKGAVPLRSRAQQLYDMTNDWRERWRDVKTFISPNRGRFLNSSTQQAYQGAPEDLEILNNVAQGASRVLRSGIMSGLTAPSTPWFSLVLPEKDYANNEKLALWIRDVRDKILSVLAHSNFYLSMENVYAEVVDFGIGAMIIEEDENEVIRCIPLSVGEYQIDTDDRGRPNCLYRRFYLTADQIVNKFGRDKLPRVLENDYRTQSAQTFLVIHAIEPRGTRKLPAALADDMKYTSAYFMHSQYDDEKDLLRFGGYRVQPFVAPRWMVVSNEKYGVSPGMDALNDVRMVQQEAELFFESYEKVANPAVNAPPNLTTNGVDMNPGAVNTIYSSGEIVSPVHVPTLDYNGHIMLEETLERRIKDAFYVNLFSAFIGSTKRMTAEEAAMLRSEKMTQIGPVLERLQTEGLAPVIDRLVDILIDAGVVSDVPSDFDGGVVELQYNGLLAQAQRASDTRPLEQWLQFLAGLAQMDPTAMDRVNLDAVSVEYARWTNVAPEFIRTDEEIQALRDQRQQQQQQQQQAEMATNVLPAVADSAKILSETNVGGGGVTALDSLLLGG